MKNIIITLILFSVVAFSNAQIVTIPDANFKAKLLEADWNNQIASSLYYDSEIIDTNGDGEIQVSEAEFITGLDISFSNIVDLTGIEAFSNLEILNCLQNDLTTLDVSQNTSLQSLSCSGNQLSSLDVTALQQLNILSCGGNPLTNLDVSQNPNLQILYITSSMIENIDLSQNVNLETLSFEYTSISSIDLSSNINLKSLTFSNTSISSLDITQNINLEELRCNSTLLTSLNVSQNPNLIYLDCNDNQISTLDVTQNSNLENLYCDQNQLSSIDVTQNSNLIWLACSENQISNIDVTQNPNLERLSFNLNQVSSIDLTQNPELYDLACASNLLTTLDLSQNGNLNAFYCLYNSLLETIFIKNGSFETLPYFHSNPNLQYICADEDEISYLEGILGSDGVEINSYCSSIPGGVFNTISGSLTYDTNNDGCDGNDSTNPLIGIVVAGDNTIGTVFPDFSGNYNFYTGLGNQTITTNLENPDWYTISPTLASTNFTDYDTVFTQDFCITPNGTHNDLEIVIAPMVPAQPGFDATYQIVYKNKGNQTLSGAIDLSYDDSVLDFVSSTLVPDVQSGGSLTWNYTDLNPFESRTIQFVLNVNSPMETPPVNNDDVLAFTVTASPLSGDETPTDNTFELNQIVVGSYDPNDITCLEGDVVSPERIGEYLHYNIRFENTGTAPATFIVVKDLIYDTKYDLSTLQILSASHDMVTRVEGNQVEFFFEAINLAPLEQGNVLFKIKSLNTLVTGDSVSQQAEIYFDYNFPIITNIALTTFENLSVENPETNKLISVYPNPTSRLLTINSRSSINSLELFDIQGRRVQSFSISEANTIDMSNVSKGVYFLDIKTNSGTAVKKIIKD